MAGHDATIAFRLIRAVGLLLVGLVGFVASFRRLGMPAQATERTGWLYQQYGADGVVYGMLVLTGVMALVGAALLWNVWRGQR